MEENFGGEDLALGVGVSDGVDDDGLVFAEGLVVLVGEDFEEFFHGLFFNFEHFGEDAFGDGEGFGFGLYFGGVEV